jgi:hypothetical protein
MRKQGLHNALMPATERNVRRVSIIAIIRAYSMIK